MECSRSLTSTIEIKQGRVHVNLGDGSNLFWVEPLEAVRFGKTLVAMGEHIINEQSKSLKALLAPQPEAEGG